MHKLLILIMLGITMSVMGQQQDDPFVFNTPKEWRRERIPFPLGFAPDINYKGFEELRFAPGMFKADSETYFTYVFLMWIEGRQNFDEKSMSDMLQKYYRGLCSAVGKARKLELDLSKITVEVKDKGKNPGEYFEATVDWFDPFVTGKPLRLYFEVWVSYAGKQDHTALFACASPLEKTSPVWEQLRQIKNDFAVKE